MIHGDLEKRSESPLGHLEYGHMIIISVEPSSINHSKVLKELLKWTGKKNRK